MHDKTLLNPCLQVAHIASCEHGMRAPLGYARTPHGRPYDVLERHVGGKCVVVPNELTSIFPLCCHVVACHVNSQSST